MCEDIFGATRTEKKLGTTVRTFLLLLDQGAFK